MLSLNNGGISKKHRAGNKVHLRKEKHNTACLEFRFHSGTFPSFPLPMCPPKSAQNGSLILCSRFWGAQGKPTVEKRQKFHCTNISLFYKWNGQHCTQPCIPKNVSIKWDEVWHEEKYLEILGSSLLNVANVFQGRNWIHRQLIGELLLFFLCKIWTCVCVSLHTDKTTFASQLLGFTECWCC